MQVRPFFSLPQPLVRLALFHFPTYLPVPDEIFLSGESGTGSPRARGEPNTPLHKKKVHNDPAPPHSSTYLTYFIHK